MKSLIPQYRIKLLAYKVISSKYWNKNTVAIAKFYTKWKDLIYSLLVLVAVFTDNSSVFKGYIAIIGLAIMSLDFLLISRVLENIRTLTTYFDIRPSPLNPNSDEQCVMKSSDLDKEEAVFYHTSLEVLHRVAIEKNKNHKLFNSHASILEEGIIEIDGDLLNCLISPDGKVFEDRGGLTGKLLKTNHQGPDKVFLQNNR